MKSKNQFTLLIILLIILTSIFFFNFEARTESTPNDLAISGLVNQSINFTYGELQKFQMVSEVAPVECVGGGTQTYNWTGIPLFFLLSMTGVKANAMKVVFYAKDDFSSSLTIERAMHPTTLIALQANGTVLSDYNGYPYRLVVPCKYGYKWVKWITSIELVDYDYKGTYESLGYSDEADIPDCTIPSTTPPFENFHIVMENATYSITTLSNSTIDSLDFDTLQKQIIINIIGPTNTTGYCYIIIPKELLWFENPEQCQIWVNNTLLENRKIIEDTNHTYIYFTYNNSAHVYVVPEFPAWASTFFMLTITAVLIVICKRRILKNNDPKS
jgi:hypothetical protein